MIFVLLVTAMDLSTIVAVMLLLYGAVKGAKEALRDGGDFITVPESNSKGNPGKVLALVIVEDIEGSEESKPSMKYEASMLPWIENSQIMLPWIESVKSKDDDEDSSGESDSDEYSDSTTESDTDSDSNYYHEDDYIKDVIKKQIKLLNVDKNNLVSLRKRRWKSCQKTAAKYCRKACKVSYKNACKQETCKKNLKKILKKQCKSNCIDFFELE